MAALVHPATQPEPLQLAKRRGRGESCTVESEGPPESQPKRARLSVIRPGVPQQTPIHAFRVVDRPSPPLRDDDKDGHYQYELGENISTRYKILSKMGEGTFGRVLECWDRKKREYVAIKIVRNIDKYRHAAMIELEVLNTLERNDPAGNMHCVALCEWFDYRGHVCMVFEKLGLSLYDFMRKNGYRPFTIDFVQDFSRQLLESVSYMHELQLVHTDLKPENILLVAQESSRSTSAGSNRPSHLPSSSDIKVIDFGSATFEEQYHSTIVSTRHYRAPEVILGFGWSYPCDMWSVGCIIVELLTGEALFQTHENLEHLAMMEAVLGPIPGSLVGRCGRGSAAARNFTPAGALNWPDGAASRKSVKAVKRLAPLRQIVAEHGDASARPYADELVDLVGAMLRYEPEARLTAAQALAHPFLQRRLHVSSAASAPAPPAPAPPAPAPVPAGDALTPVAPVATD